MTKSFDRLNIYAYYLQPTFRKKIQKLITLSRFSKPGGNLIGSNGNTDDWYPSRKMTSLIQAESRRIEFSSLSQFEYDDDTLEQFNQPP